MSPAVLEVEALTKRYRKGVLANDGVSIQVEAGEVFGLLGPNGAGKTTLVSQILGLLAPDAGSVRIGGQDVTARPERARWLCSYQPQADAPVDGLSPREAVELVGRIRGGAAAAVRRRCDQLLGELDLMGAADQRVPLSGGMARLTGFCMAAVRPGAVVVLDEPTNDVDPLRRRALWALIRSLADDGAGVVLVTHNVIESERCVDRLAIMGAGRVLSQGTPAQLKAGLEAPLRIELALDEPGSEPAGRPPGLVVTSITGRRMLGQMELADVGAVVAWAKQQQDQGAVSEFSVGPASLEDVYARWVESPEEAGL
ncbi:MAG: ABC transporter ATP-binding protein [Acidimicrobiales bacterium]